MENQANALHIGEVLTLADVAAILRCSKAHVCNVINGKVPDTPRLPHLAVGRRKLVRREWLEAWMEQSKRQC
jgi:P2-related tail formation protein